MPGDHIYNLCHTNYGTCNILILQLNVLVNQTQRYIQPQRTLATYTTALEMRSKSTQKLFKCVLNNLSLFGKICVDDLSMYDEDNIYDVLQEWILWNSRRGTSASTIVSYFNSFKAYLWYQRIKLDWRDIKQNLIFPKMLYEAPVPLSPNDMQSILHASKQEFRFQLLALVSSGIRVSELGQIRYSYLDLGHSNIMVRIPAHVSKTRRSRISFFSQQASDMIRYRLDKAKTKELDLVFCGDRTPEHAVNLMLKRFGSARRKVGLTKKHNYGIQNRYEVHLHSLRAYFITTANKVQFGLGHVLAGHDFYMKEYNVYSVGDLRNMYKKVDKALTFRSAHA